NARLIQVLHDMELDKASTEEALFALKDQSIDIVPLVNQSNPKVLQLVLSEPLIADQNYDLKLPPRKSEKGPLIPGSTQGIIFDQRPPEIVLVESVNENEIMVSF